MNYNDKLSFLKTAYSNEWVTYTICKDDVQISDFNLFFLQQIGIPIVKKTINISNQKNKDIFIDKYDILPVEHLSKLSTEFGNFYIIAEVLGYKIFFLGIDEKSDNLYIIIIHENTVTRICIINKNISTYLYFYAKFHQFSCKYEGQYPINRSEIRADYKVLFDELVEEDPDMILEQNIEEKDGFLLYMSWKDKYLDLSCIYHDWIIADSELPPAPPGYDPAWLQDDDDLPF